MSSQTPHRDESSSAAPGLSPGVVNNDELLLRSVFFPDDFINGEIVNTSVSLDDLRFYGYSVNRQRYVTRDVIESGIDRYLETPREGVERESLGIACFKTSTIREMEDPNGSQAFVVIDTALTENPAHASIYAANPSISKGQTRRLRKLLFPLLDNPVSVDQALAMGQVPACGV